MVIKHNSSSAIFCSIALFIMQFTLTPSNAVAQTKPAITLVEVGDEFKLVNYQYRGDDSIVENDANIEGTHPQAQLRHAQLLAKFASRIELANIENLKIRNWIAEIQPRLLVYSKIGSAFALMEVGKQIRIVHYEIGENGTAYHDGDIILGSHQQLQSRQAELLAALATRVKFSFIKDEKIKGWLKNTSNLPSPNGFTKGAFSAEKNKWSDNTITYYFDKSVSVTLRKRVEKAAKIWNNSDIKLKIVKSTKPNTKFLKIFLGSFCGSNIGAPIEKSTLVVMQLHEEHCKLGNIIHEFFHVAGFIHEHQRDTRNDYLKWVAGFGTNFNEGLERAENQTKYDICSISHYGEVKIRDPKMPTRFTITEAGRKAINDCRSQFSGNPIIPGQRQKLSKLDIKAINSKYP